MATGLSEGVLLLSIWTDHFEQLADEARWAFPNLLDQVKDEYVASEWWKVYDFVQFVIDYPLPNKNNDQLISACNAVRERHVSAYRIVGTTLAPITSEQEIEAIEKALNHANQF